MWSRREEASSFSYFTRFSYRFSKVTQARCLTSSSFFLVFFFLRQHWSAQNSIMTWPQPVEGQSRVSTTASWWRVSLKDTWLAGGRLLGLLSSQINNTFAFYRPALYSDFGCRKTTVKWPPPLSNRGKHGHNLRITCKLHFKTAQNNAKN